VTTVVAVSELFFSQMELLRAVMDRNFNQVKLLLQRGDDVNYVSVVVCHPSLLSSPLILSVEWLHPLHVACFNGDDATASLLLERGADPSLRSQVTVALLPALILSPGREDSSGLGKADGPSKRMC
jgi:hypothetical protein